MIDALKKIYADSIPENVRKNFNNIVFMYLINGIFSACYAPFWGYIAKDRFDAGPFCIALVLTAQSAYGVISLVVTGFIPDGKEHHFSKYIRMIASIFLVLSVFTPLFPPMLRAPIFCSLLFCFHFSACYPPVDNAVFAKIFTLDIRTRMLGYAKMFHSVMSMIVTLLAGLIIDKIYYGISMWQVVFVIGGICLASCGLIMGRLNIRADNIKKDNPLVFIKHSFGLLNTDRFNIFLIISGIFYTIGFNMFQTLYPIYQVEALHLKGAQVSVLSVTASLTLIFAFPILGTFYAKKNPIKAWFFVFPLMIIYPLFYIFVGNCWWPVIIGNILNQAFLVTNDIAWLNMIIYLGGKDKVKEYQGLYAFFIGVRAFISLLAAPNVINFCKTLSFGNVTNLKIAFIAGIGFCVLSLIFMLPMIKVAKTYTERNK